jgi:hypothetical protein
MLSSPAAQSQPVIAIQQGLAQRPDSIQREFFDKFGKSTEPG